jgi:predicted transposase YbfD/YdcC
LIELLNIEGMVVTTDAMHYQKETAEIIIKIKEDSMKMYMQ